MSQPLLGSAKDNKLLAEQNQNRASSRKHKDEFLSLAAHEIRTPITVIKAQAQLAELFHSKGKFEGEIVVKCLKTFVRESDRLARLCTDLLDVARLDNGTLEVRLTEFALLERIQSVVEKVNSKLEQHEVVFNVLNESGKSEFDSLKVFADPERVEQVLMNLLNNSIRYSPQGGAVVISLSAANSFIEVSVRDKGVGIPADKLTRLFERYYQAHQTGLKGPGGLGIGLYLCRELLQRMGGAIVANSEGAGLGAEFMFTIPVVRSLDKEEGDGGAIEQ